MRRADLVLPCWVHVDLDFSQTTLNRFYSLWLRERNSSALLSTNNFFSLCFIKFPFPSLVHTEIGSAVISRVIYLFASSKKVHTLAEELRTTKRRLSFLCLINPSFQIHKL